MINVTEQRQIICFIVLSILKGNFKSESTADRCATKILPMFEEIIILRFSFDIWVDQAPLLTLIQSLLGKISTPNEPVLYSKI